MARSAAARLPLEECRYILLRHGPYAGDGQAYAKALFGGGGGVGTLLRPQAMIADSGRGGRGGVCVMLRSGSFKC